MTTERRPPIRTVPRAPDAPRLRFRRGRRFPRAIAWYGLTSFWGHLWHLAASVIATEDIDSRDWMVADDPDELTRRVISELGLPSAPSAPAGASAGVAGAGAHPAATLTDALDGDLWLDFVADTGDDSSVSGAVARLLFERYEVPDPDEPGRLLELPRGHLLVFGGDTAYPVATDLEIQNRVIVPWNRVLKQVADGEPRVLLGVPGNHDWYAGLDGFGRMFRRRSGSVDRASEEVYRLGQIGRFIEWIEAFRIGQFVGKRPALPLHGYVPVQSASYWVVRLAPGLDFLGPDRQLRSMDLGQRAYFARARGGEPGGAVLCLADPVLAFLEPSAAGEGLLAALDLTLKDDGPLVLTGDTHQYCRQVVGRGLHVTAGGGGAFLHPARILRRGLTPPEAEFPGPRASLALALRIPWRMATGGSGLLLHLVVAAIYLSAFGAEMARPGAKLAASTATAAVVAVLCATVGGWRQGKGARIGALALLAGAAFGFIPFAVEALAEPTAQRLGYGATTGVGGAALFAFAVVAGTFVIGCFLTALTVLGLEQHQAFGALAHPGYKHFLRLRVRRDGTAVDGFAIGKVDPLDGRDPVVLVDHFRWMNPRPRGAG